MFVLRRLFLIAGAGVLAAAQGVAEPDPVWQLCSGFSEEQQHRDPPLSWKFRSCTSAHGQRDVQLQFKNRSAEPVAFEFRLWTHPPRTCRTEEQPAAKGERSLAGNAVEEWPYTVSTLDDSEEFKGRIWVCVREVGR